MISFSSKSRMSSGWELVAMSVAVVMAAYHERQVARGLNAEVNS